MVKTLEPTHLHQIPSITVTGLGMKSLLGQPFTSQGLGLHICEMGEVEHQLGRGWVGLRR